MSTARDLLRSTLSFLEISMTSITGSHGLQRSHRQESSLLSGCKGHPCFSLAFGSTEFSHLVGSSFHPDCHLPSTPAGLCPAVKPLLAESPQLQCINALILEHRQEELEPRVLSWRCDIDVISAAVCGTSQKA